MSPAPPPRAPGATGVRMGPGSPKSAANRSSSAGQRSASALPARAAIRTRVSRMTASPRLASSATNAAAPRSSTQRPSSERGRKSRAARMPRSSTKARTRQAVSVSSRPRVAAGTRPGDNQLTGPVAHHRADLREARDLQRPVAGQTRHLEEASQPGAGPPLDLGKAGGQSQQRQVERRVDVEPRPGPLRQVAAAEAGALQAAGGGVVRRAGLQPIDGAIEIRAQPGGAVGRRGCLRAARQPPRRHRH